MTKNYDISIEEVRRMYFEQNLSQNELAKKMGVSQEAISRKMRKFKLATKPRTRNLWVRKYGINEWALDILTPQSAWVLGG